MKILLLGPLNSIHFQRWISGLNDEGHEIVIFSQHYCNEWSLPIGVKAYIFPFKGILGYFLNAIILKIALRKVKPDLINSHYGSGYGTTARLVNYHPTVLSIWGSDIYDFPYKSVVHRWLIVKNLLSADQIASTSNCMAVECRKLVPSLTNIAITHFGVNLSSYADHKPAPAKHKKKLIIGTVKTMMPKYGIDTLIEAFALLHKSLRAKQGPDLPEIELRLVGGGAQTPELRCLAVSLGVADIVNFVGQVRHDQVPEELAHLDIYVALSRLDSESFGVSIIEAGAAGRPVVVSDAGGLPEVTVDGVTGFVVPRDNPSAAAAAMERLVLDSSLRYQMGRAGQAHVSKHYSWDSSVLAMLAVYEETIKRHKSSI